MPADSRMLICGNPAMLDDVRDALAAKALLPDRTSVPGNFATENYW
jgi:ferredoxin--NADP+ reductase